MIGWSIARTRRAVVDLDALIGYIDDPVRRNVGAGIDPVLGRLIGIQGRIGDFDDEARIFRPRMSILDEVLPTFTPKDCDVRLRFAIFGRYGFLVIDEPARREHQVE